MKPKKYKETYEEDADEHLGCPSYPNCDIDPLGCLSRTDKDDIDWYGQKE